MKSIKSFLLAVLIYLPTLVLVPQVLVYVLISLIGFLLFLKDVKNNNISKNDFNLIVFVILSFIIFFIGKPYAIDETSKSINDYIPYTFFILCTIFFVKYLNNKVLSWVLFFILFESFIGIVQYIIGVPYFFEPRALGLQEFGESEYLYYNKVYGLSSVSSIFALKIFSGFLILHYLINYKFKKYLYIILVGGLIVTFNRTAIISTIVFISLILFKNFKKNDLKFKFVTLLALFIIISFITYSFEIIINQLFRGKEIDMSGRDFVFPYYIDFIENHLFFGNFFTKHWVSLSSDRVYHAHNSFLQTFANMGLFFGSILMLIIFKKINKKNLVYILPIFVYSIFQYGILWGISFLDIIFFYFLFKIVNSPENNSLDKKRLALE